MKIMKRIDDMRIIRWDSKARNCTSEPYHLGQTVAEHRKQVGVNVTLSDEPIAKKTEQKIPYYKGLSGK